MVLANTLGTKLRQTRKAFNASSADVIRERMTRIIDDGHPYGTLTAVLYRELSLTSLGVVGIDSGDHPDNDIWLDLVSWGEEQGLVITLRQSHKAIDGVCEVVAIPQRNQNITMDRGFSLAAGSGRHEAPHKGMAT